MILRYWGKIIFLKACTIDLSADSAVCLRSISHVADKRNCVIMVRPLRAGTGYTYFEDDTDGDSYTKLQSVNYPDGGWEYYTYDSSGRIAARYRSLLDLTVDQRESAEMTTYSYDPSTLGSGDGNLVEDRNKPRIVTVSKNQVVVSRTSRGSGLTF